MSATETNSEESEEGPRSESPPVSGRPTKALFTMMEDEAGGATPEPSDITDYNREFVYQELSPKDYHSSNFPSLISQLGPNARHRTRRNYSRHTQLDSKDGRYVGQHEKSSAARDREQLTFGEQMRRRNEAQWLRIEAVVKEKMDYYDRYVSDMTTKIKQQRARINQRTEQLLQSLQKQEQRTAPDTKN